MGERLQAANCAPAEAVRVIACGALAGEILAIKAQANLGHIDLVCLPAILHNSPQDIPAAVEAAMNGKAQASYGPALEALADAAAADATYYRAVSAINRGEYETGLHHLKTAALAFGPHPDILTYQGFANRKLARFTTAEAYYNRALAIAPEHLGALEYYGELKVERGDLTGARAHLAKLDTLCSFGCFEAEELRGWIAKADS